MSAKKEVLRVYPNAVVKQDGNMFGCKKDPYSAPFAYGSTPIDAWKDAEAQLKEHIKRVPDE